MHKSLSSLISIIILFSFSFVSTFFLISDSETLGVTAVHISGLLGYFSFIMFIAIFKIHYVYYIYVWSILLSFFALLSTVLSLSPSTSFFGALYRYEGLITLLSYHGLFIGASLLTRASDSANRKKIIVTFASVGILNASLGLIQKFYPNDLFLRLFTNRVEGLNGNPNFFGTFLVLQSGISIVAATTAKSRKLRLFFTTLSTLFFILAIFSHTESSWVGIFSIYLILFIIFFIQLIKKNAAVKSYMSRLLAVAGLSLISFIVINIFENWVYLGSIGITIGEIKQVAEEGGIVEHMGSRRGLIWKTVMRMLPDYWLTGCGVDALGIAMGRLDPSTVNMPGGVSPSVIDKAHNEVLHIAITQGIPAAITYLVWLGFVIKNGIKRVKESKLFSHDPDAETDPNAWVWLALLMAVIGYFVQSNFNISVVTVAPYFWIFAGLLCPYPWDEKSLVKRDLGNSFKLVRKNKDK
jgi:putative inorganic carbon (HCO3(-)) transporter